MGVATSGLSARRRVSPDPAFGGAGAHEPERAAADARVNRLGSRASSVLVGGSLEDPRVAFARQVSADLAAAAEGSTASLSSTSAGSAAVEGTASGAAGNVRDESPTTVHMRHFRPAAITTLPRSLSVPASVKRASLVHYTDEDVRHDGGSDDGGESRGCFGALSNGAPAVGLALGHLDESESPPSGRRAGSDSPSRRFGRGGSGGGFGGGFGRGSGLRLDTRSPTALTIGGSGGAPAMAATPQLQLQMQLDQPDAVAARPALCLGEDALALRDDEELLGRGEEVPRTPTSFATFVPSSFRLAAPTAARLVREMTEGATTIRLLAIDFDKTLVGVHTRARWREGPEALAKTVRPVFRTLIPAALDARLSVAIVTFSKQEKLIRGALEIAFGPERAARIIVRTDRTPGLSKRERGSAWETGKQWHLLSALQEIGMCSKSPRGWGDVAKTLSGDAPSTPVADKWGALAVEGATDAAAAAGGAKAPGGETTDEAMRTLMRGVVLIDDDMRNIRLALRAGAVALGFVEEKQLNEDLLKRFGVEQEEPAAGSAWTSSF
jgi:hypothetical protein